MPERKLKMYQQQLAQLQASIKKMMFADFPTLHFYNPQAYHMFWEDFTNYTGTIVTGNPPTVPGWTAAQAANLEGDVLDAEGTPAMTAPNAIGGVLRLDSEAATTQHNGIQLQKDGETFTPDASMDLWFEARFMLGDNAADLADCEIFIGLAETDATLMPAGAIDHANTEYIGFCIETGWAGAMQFVAATGAANETGVVCTTIVENTWYRVAFCIKGLTTAYQFVDDTQITNTIGAGFLPNVDLKVSLVCQSDDVGTPDDPILYIDYIRVLQFRSYS